MSSTAMTRSDQSEIERFAHLVIESGSVAELRIPKAGRAGTVSGYFDDPAAFVKAGEKWSGKAPGVYATLNPCKTALLARSQNRTKQRVDTTTTDKEIAKRRWLPIDFDPVRPTGISSDEVEHQAALARAQACRSWLTALGWPEPVYADSGNGAHLLYRIDLPSDDASRALIQRVLHALAWHLSDDEVKLDEAVSNAARIWKVYGTLCCKGDSIPERPHRLARILEAPLHPAIVSQELLADLAAMVPEQPQAARDVRSPGHTEFDLDAWITEHGLSVLREGAWDSGGRKWILNPCPWNADHTDKAAYIVQFANGAIAAGCHHNGCTGKGWRDLRDLYEPDRHQRREAWEAGPTQAVNGAARVAQVAGGQNPPPTTAVHGVETDNFDISAIPLSDTYNAYRLVQAYGDVIRYCGEWGKCMTYEGGIWQVDYASLMVENAKDVALTMVDEARQRLASIEAESLDLKAQEQELLAKNQKLDRDSQLQLRALAAKYRAAKAYLAHATKTLGKRKLLDMIELARSVEPVPVSPDQLDQHHMLLPVENGVIDLKTGEFLPHNPAHLFTRRMDIDYDREATCPKWEKALYEMMGGPLGDDSPEDSGNSLEARHKRHERAMRLVTFLQRSFGYMLTGTTHEQLIWIFTGSGSNGKSLVISTMLDLFGDYGHKATQGLFEDKQFETHLTERASLFGRRLVATTEGKAGRRLDASFIKEATGDDPLTVRRMREDPWTFKPTHHIVMATNHLPHIDDHSHGMWRRVRLVPFDVTFHDPDTADPKILNDPRIPKQNKNLANELRDELPGILCWCVKGCIAWQKDGLTYPDEVRLATEDYRRDQNNVEEFVAEGCHTGPNYHARAPALYEGYKTWCGQNEQEPCSNSIFGKKMKELGYQPSKSNGIRRYLNIAAREIESDDVENNSNSRSGYQGQDRVRN